MHAARARYLANQEWVKTDSLKAVENTAIPIIMLVVEVPCDLVCSIQSPKDGPDCITVDSNSNTNVVGFEDCSSKLFTDKGWKLGKCKMCPS
ncbi:hypothetical protein Bca52824_044356 [Brassica carinata]|uniref:Uncharacterized protein n=1 Tax=Brassica carinata TaxID=52824 RepID=A0A8X7S110_BRACI|nr:hypothetical protein Bca52824_044356 [Brassica carinata]